MMSGARVVGALMGTLVLTGGAYAARLTVTASRAETLYSPTSSPDCTALSKITDDGRLPFYVVRLRATLPAGAPTSGVRYQWRLPSPNVGVLAADEDLGPDAQASVVRTLCTDVGNRCVLTEEQLVTYNRPTVLWIAPMCDVLPEQTTRPFRGGSVRIGVRATAGKRRLGKGASTVGYGRMGSATLLVATSPSSNDPQDRRFRDGVGKPDGEPIPLNPVFGAQLASVAGLPLVERFVFDSGGGGSVTVPSGCGLGLDACTHFQDVLYTEGGKHLAMLRVELADQSALCDNLTVNVTTSPKNFTLDVTTDPSKHAFTPGEPVTLHVRVKNTSPPSDLPGILFVGSVVSCETEVRIGDSTLTKTAQIDLQHCSGTVDQPCRTDADCRPPDCSACEPSEICLTSSHCGNDQFALGCATDRDCPVGTPCVQVLPLESIFLGRGDVVDFVNSTVTVDNLLPARAAVTDTWTVHSFNAGDQTDTLKYRIGAGTPPP